jgi:hypothetical protein
MTNISGQGHAANKPLFGELMVLVELLLVTAITCGDGMLHWLRTEVMNDIGPSFEVTWAVWDDTR